jgi:hypothetical protein
MATSNGGFSSFPQAPAVRVIGKPACDHNQRQSFSSCMGIEIYEQ